MKKIQLGGLVIALLMCLQAFGSGDQPPPVRDTKEYNLGANALAISGYDPVSYFADGGGVATQGKEEFTLEYKKVAYRFTSQENLEKFVSKPKKYEPTYGNWCAYAMAFNQKVDIDPKLFTISGDRLHLFVSESAKLEFDGNIPAFERRADANWKKISGESPRK
ncbi:MAG: YHS domain protein [Bdellovibrionales bacterium]|nr:YHS domain protein [Bdellovibrionales bacterium]